MMEESYGIHVGRKLWNPCWKKATESMLEESYGIHVGRKLWNPCWKKATESMLEESYGIHVGRKLWNPCWKKATESQKLDYRDELCRELQDINIPLYITNCHDVLCKNELHKSPTDELMLDILLSIGKSANAHIPKPKVNSSQHKPNIPNWKYFGTPFGCQLENHLIVNYIRL